MLRAAGSRMWRVWRVCCGTQSVCRPVICLPAEFSVFPTGVCSAQCIRTWRGSRPGPVELCLPRCALEVCATLCADQRSTPHNPFEASLIVSKTQTLPQSPPYAVNNSLKIPVRLCTPPRVCTRESRDARRAVGMGDGTVTRPADGERQGLDRSRRTMSLPSGEFSTCREVRQRFVRASDLTQSLRGRP